MAIFDKSNDPTAFSRTLLITLQLGCLLAWGLDRANISDELRKNIMTALYKLTRMKLTTCDGRTPLHYACNNEGLLLSRYQPCQFPSVSLARALIKVGADPNAEDSDGNRPLHMVSLLRSQQKEIALVLLENGAHFVSRGLQLQIFKIMLFKTTID